MTDCEGAVKSVIEMRKQGMRLGTERTRSLLDRLGSPDEKLKIIHVAGSNGKGSVCEYLTEILLCAGKTVGTYTTPEVFSYEEQFRINGECSAALAAEYTAAAQRAAEVMEDKPTAYERQTAAAYLMFASEDCEYAVIECCLGGLEDTTNAAKSKIVAVISSVSLEHTAVLGNDILSICRHKAGIIKNCPAVVSSCVPREARVYFSALGAQFAGDDISIVSSDKNGSRFICGGKEYYTRMAGCMQPYNAATAIKAAQIVGIDGDAITRGVALAKLEGRLQIIRACGRDYVLDGSHNPESAAPLAQLLETEYSGRRRTLVFGCLSDKDIKSVLGVLSGCFERVIAVRPDSYRAMDALRIFSECKAAFGFAQYAESVSSALDMADGDVVAVCGSFTLLKEAKQWTEKKQLKR